MSAGGRGALAGVVGGIVAVCAVLHNCSTLFRDGQAAETWAREGLRVGSGIVTGLEVARDAGQFADRVSEGASSASKIGEGVSDASKVSEGASGANELRDFNQLVSGLGHSYLAAHNDVLAGYEEITNDPASKLVQNPPTKAEFEGALGSNLAADSQSTVGKAQAERIWWDIAAEKDPSRCVTRVVPLMIKPMDPAGYQNIFGHPPTAAQMGWTKAITTGLGQERTLGTSADNLLALEAAIDVQTQENDLVVIVGHNVAGQGNLPVLKLASGQTVTSDQLREIGDKKKRQIVIVCCWAQESGITGKITYGDGVQMVAKINELVKDSDPDIGIHVGLVCHTLPAIYSSIVTERNVKQGLIVVAVTGGTGWTVYEFSAAG